MFKKENQRGITLISLVITIIIMIILATVAINLAVDGNGLFRRAGDTANIWNNSVEQEETTIQNLLDMADKIGGQTSNEGEASRPGEETQDTEAPTAPTGIEKIEETKTTEIISELPQGWNASSVTKVAKEKVTNITVKASGGTDATSEVAGYKYSIDNTNWTETVATSQSQELSDTNGITKIYVKTVDTAGNESEIYEKKVARTAPIPVGYVEANVTTEDDILEGLVIYEKTGDITEVTAENHNTALTSCNQYVWIPVDSINDMVMCKEHGATVTLNTTTLQCPTCLADTKLAGKLYATDTGNTFNTGLDNQTYTNDDDANFSSATVKLREPDDLTHTTYGDASSTGRTAIKGILNNTTATAYADIKDEWNDLLQDDFENMAKSVAKYGGFYISRYEIGEGGISKKEQTVLNNSGSTNWWSLFSTLRSNPKVEAPVYSQMIWGSQYDQVMKFINGKTDGTGATYNVTQYSSTRHKGSYVGGEVSGNNNDDLVCNIYDLEGNYFEWTSEAPGTYGRVSRGR